jgi:hypothetical protein
METEKNNLYSRYKQDADACKNGYYGYELWLENKLTEAESELKKLRVTDVSGRSEQLCQWHDWVKHPSHAKIGAMICINCRTELA